MTKFIGYQTAFILSHVCISIFLRSKKKHYSFDRELIGAVPCVLLQYLPKYLNAVGIQTVFGINCEHSIRRNCGSDTEPMALEVLL